MIEVLPLATGRLLISAGPFCVESDRDDASLDEAIKVLSDLSGEDRQRINVMVARATLADV